MTDISRTLSLMESIMDNLDTPFFSRREKALTPVPINISETKTDVILRYEVPGAKKEDIDLQFERGFVKISVNKFLPEEEGETSVSKEFALKESCSRKVKILVPVNFEKAKASYTDGVLVLKLPKTEQAIASKILIE